GRPPPRRRRLPPHPRAGGAAAQPVHPRERLGRGPRGPRDGHPAPARAARPPLRHRADRPGHRAVLRGQGVPRRARGRGAGAGRRVGLPCTAHRGERLEVVDVTFFGNEPFSDATLRKRLKNKPEARWWRFWKRETFDEEAFDEDLQNLVRFYSDRGYYDARVVR